MGRSLQRAKAATAADTAPAPEFQAALRQRLMAVAAVQGIGATDTSEAEDDQGLDARRVPPNRRRFAFAAALAAGVLGLSGVSVASGDAIPGDTLYPVKRSTERAQLALAGSDVNRGQLYLEFARNRLTEAGRVIDDPVGFTTALADMDAEFTQGVQALHTAAVDRQDAEILDTVNGFVAEQSPQVSKMMTDVTGESFAAAAESLSLLDAAEQRAHELRGSLLCTATTDLPADELGPLPGTCAALPGGADGLAVAPQPTSLPKSSRDERDHTDPVATPSPTPAGSGAPSESPGEDPGLVPDTPGEDGDIEPTSEVEDSLLDDIGDALSGILG